jgi:hypothetical protein
MVRVSLPKSTADEIQRPAWNWIEDPAALTASGSCRPSGQQVRGRGMNGDNRKPAAPGHAAERDGADDEPIVAAAEAVLEVRSPSASRIRGRR